MRKTWLRGMLLGVSLSLLLAGGVALAQGANVFASRDCVPCVPNSYWGDEQGVPLDPYTLTVMGTDWPPNTELYHELWWPNGEWWDESLWTDGNGEFAFPVDIAFWCECPPEEEPAADAYEVRMSQDGAWMQCPLAFGELEFYYVYENLSLIEETVFVQLAEVCEEDFVPEPGTIALLGSGLVGLAGYAALRWRTRE